MFLHNHTCTQYNNILWTISLPSTSPLPPTSWSLSSTDLPLIFMTSVPTFYFFLSSTTLHTSFLISVWQTEKWFAWFQIEAFIWWLKKKHLCMFHQLRNLLPTLFLSILKKCGFVSWIFLKALSEHHCFFASYLAHHSLLKKCLGTNLGNRRRKILILIIKRFTKETGNVLNPTLTESLCWKFIHIHQKLFMYSDIQILLRC